MAASTRSAWSSDSKAVSLAGIPDAEGDDADADDEAEGDDGGDEDGNRTGKSGNAGADGGGRGNATGEEDDDDEDSEDDSMVKVAESTMPVATTLLAPGTLILLLTGTDAEAAAAWWTPSLIFCSTLNMTILPLTSSALFPMSASSNTSIPWMHVLAS